MVVGTKLRVRRGSSCELGPSAANERRGRFGAQALIFATLFSTSKARFELLNLCHAVLYGMFPATCRL